MYIFLEPFFCIVSLELKFKFLTKIKDVIGKINKTKREIDIQIIFQSYNERKKIINTGSINSAVDNPNQIVLRAFPLDLVKYLETVVVAVWDIIPCPENLIKKIAINNKLIDDIVEKKKLENDNSSITKKANLDMFISSIFFPTQIKIKLLSNVAEA